jgi:hypothetical protein
MKIKAYKRLWIGVDFDGTIVESAWPGIGSIKPKTVELMKKAYEAGHCIIIWTARGGQSAEEAKKFLIENNIPFNYFNENPEDPMQKESESPSRKLHFNILIDDTAVNVNDVDTIMDLLFKCEH